MAHYLVTASPRAQRLQELQSRLARDEFVALRPFGRELSSALCRARQLPDGRATWEEEDYCRPPLAQERDAVLDQYFDDLTVEPVVQGSGWELIDPLPPLFPDLAGR
ncbi:MAG TPA: hypothetical protein VF046_03815 [Gemmatimonadales bacterium]